jgi:hypothetical protein
MRSGSEWPSHDPPLAPHEVRTCRSKLQNDLPQTPEPKPGERGDTRPAEQAPSKGSRVRGVRGQHPTRNPEGNQTVSRIAHERPWSNPMRTRRQCIGTVASSPVSRTDPRGPKSPGKAGRAVSKPSNRLSTRPPRGLTCGHEVPPRPKARPSVGWRVAVAPKGKTDRRSDETVDPKVHRAVRTRFRRTPNDPQDATPDGHEARSRITAHRHCRFRACRPKTTRPWHSISAFRSRRPGAVPPKRALHPADWKPRDIPSVVAPKDSDCRELTAPEGAAGPRNERLQRDERSGVATAKDRVRQVKGLSQGPPGEPGSRRATDPHVSRRSGPQSGLHHPGASPKQCARAEHTLVTGIRLVLSRPPKGTRERRAAGSSMSKASNPSARRPTSVGRSPELLFPSSVQNHGERLVAGLPHPPACVLRFSRPLDALLPP